MGRLGDEGSRQRQREAGGCQRDERCQDGTEHEGEQDDDEQDRAHDHDGLGAHRRRLLIDEDRQRTGEVQREPRVTRRAERGADGVHGVRPALPPPAVVGAKRTWAEYACSSTETAPSPIETTSGDRRARSSATLIADRSAGVRGPGGPSR